MPPQKNRLELLSPAKNADFGIEAILHGADAVYIGGPAFGARSQAGNSIEEIQRLIEFAHRFNARVLVALNTLLHDRELEPARKLAWKCYESGVDALILQDMGLLELDLPPIELHASTQCDIRTTEKARFLSQSGFSQMVLARELSLEQIREIAESTPEVTLEYFVHGSLCVGLSGLCNLSYARTGRSANRGECAQLCRLPYSLIDPQGMPIAEGKHLLSLKDNDQSANLRSLIDAGVRSFKIEGRLKDLSYVKNITAHYRLLLDKILRETPNLAQGSDGSCSFSFVPQPEKTFNRGATDYFLRGRQKDIAAFDSPKFVGERIGTIIKTGRDSFEVETTHELHNGDGITYFDTEGELVGARINRVEAHGKGFRLFPALINNRLPDGLNEKTVIYRNYDHEFDRMLQKKSAERKIAVHFVFEEMPDGFALSIRDEKGISARSTVIYPKTVTRDDNRASMALQENLRKLGNTFYRAESITVSTHGNWFIPASVINGLRRSAIEQLEVARIAAYRRPERAVAATPPCPYPESTLDYLGNVLNEKAKAFYEKHGVRVTGDALEAGQIKGNVCLMIAKHCLRFSFGLCPKETRGIKPVPMSLRHGNEELTLHFDCQRCEMHVIGKLKAGENKRPKQSR